MKPLSYALLFLAALAWVVVLLHSIHLENQMRYAQHRTMIDNTGAPVEVYYKNP